MAAEGYDTEPPGFRQARPLSKWRAVESVLVSARFSLRGGAVSLSLALTLLAAACGGEADTNAAGDEFDADTGIADSVGATLDGRQIEVHRDPG